MSNLPHNHYNSTPGVPPVPSNPGQPLLNHNPSLSQVPANQLPPGYGQIKQDANFNNSVQTVNSAQNHFNQSGTNSPAFNTPGVKPPTPGGHSSPIRPQFKPATPIMNQNPNIPSSSPKPPINSPLNSYSSGFQSQQINNNTPPLIPSSQYSPPSLNGPPGPTPPPMSKQYPPPNNMFTPPSVTPISSNAGNFRPPEVSNNVTQMPSSVLRPPPSNQPGSINSLPNIPFSGPPQQSPLVSQPFVNQQLRPTPPANGAPQTSISGPTTSVNQFRPPLGPLKGYNQMARPANGPPQTSSGPNLNQFGPPMGPSQVVNQQPRPSLPLNRQPQTSISGPNLPMNHYSSPLGPPQVGPPRGLPSGPVNTPSMIPQSSQPMPGQYSMQNGPSQPLNQPGIPSGPSQPMAQTGALSRPPQSMTQPGLPSGPPQYMTQPGLPSGPPQSMTQPGLPSGPPRPMTQPGALSRPPQPMTQPGLPPGPPYSAPQHMPPPVGPPQLPPVSQPNDALKSNMQNRYPPMPQPNYPQQMPPMQQPNMNQQYPQQQYNTQGLTQQMGQLSVTKQGYDQLWGHHMIDLMQARQILPEYPEDPPEIKLGPPFADAPNCSPEIFRCTVNKIPDTNSLLQKSRLPLGILLHPFKDLNYLPVIQCTTIVRCRACRTYINPFVYFVDAKRWKCNLCYRVNDLPEEFQYDPVSKSFGDPTRRPEVKSATIEFIAPGEYMLRPPQPAVYLFLMDTSSIAKETGYLQVVCDTLKENLAQLPGDARTQVGFICYDAHVHFYLMADSLTRPKEVTVLDIDDVFLPSPESLLVNLRECGQLVRDLLHTLPHRHHHDHHHHHHHQAAPASALGAALQAAYKLMAPTGGRVTVFQTCLPNVGPGALSSREDPNARSSKDVAHLNPATDFYKRLALDCSGAQIAVDLFLLNQQYSDLATLSGISKFSAGSVYHIPLFKASRSHQAAHFTRMLTRYLTRKIGFEAVLRVRCTRGIAIHTFHGNFFVRSTDLLSLPNVSPDAAFGMQLSIEESLSDLQQVCFQAALLYTSSKGERRIRVHTLALPIASTLPDVLHSADQQCIVGLLAKMAVDRSLSASLCEAREALVTVAVDTLSAHRLAHHLPPGERGPALHAPLSLALLPLYLLALTKAKAFRTGLSTRLDDRVAAMCGVKSLPLQELLRSVHPDLYPLHDLRASLAAHDHADHDRDQRDHADRDQRDHAVLPDPPRLHLTAERLSSNGAYLLDDGETMIIYVCHGVSPAFLSEVFGVTAFSQIQDEARVLPTVASEGNELLHAFVDKLNDDRPYAANILILRDNSPSKQLFTERLVEDRIESAFSYYEFLQNVKNQVK